MMGAALISSRIGLPTVAIARSFTIDPLFACSPYPELSRTRDYPTWTWRIPLREPTPDIVRAVNAADEKLWRHGYCGPFDRGAYFLTTLCFMAPEGDPHVFEEWLHGQFYTRRDIVTANEVDLEKCLVLNLWTNATLGDLDAECRVRLSDVSRAVWTLRGWLTQT